MAAVETDPEFDAILSSDIADLTVTSVSRRPQKLTNAAAAIYVVTQEDIKRIGATTIPDALRIVPGLQVAQVGSNKWAISARGFNSVSSNKLLVMIDNQSVYTPVFSGTYWDDRLVPLEEIDRIEVIRGPGSSIYGANAMNGIIHIITKNARDYQGNYATTGVGNEWGEVGAGHGGKLGDESYYRTYANAFTADSVASAPGDGDDWYRARAGFRVDGKRSNDDNYTFTTKAYFGEQDTFNVFRTRNAPFVTRAMSNDQSYGVSVTGNVERHFSKDSTGNLRIGLDHYRRDEALADQKVSTVDLDWQHDINTSENNTFTWGSGFRFTQVGVAGSFTARVGETVQNYEVMSAFVQDEYAILPEELWLTVGSKFEWNEFTGIEVQPSARLAWALDDKQTVWASISRAIRTPSVVEDNINLIFNTGPGPTYDVLFGSPSVESERLIAYELGHRIAVSPKLQFDNTVYYNDYDNLVTVSPGAPFFTGTTFVNPYNINNEGHGKVYGFESSATYATSPKHKLMGSYTFAHIDLNSGPGVLPIAGESLLPEQAWSLRSYWNVTPSVSFDNMLYYVDGLTSVSGEYYRYDTRLAWQATPQLELSLTGKNLLDDRHIEFPDGGPVQIERSFIGRATWRF